MNGFTPFVVLSVDVPNSENSQVPRLVVSTLPTKLFQWSFTDFEMFIVFILKGALLKAVNQLGMFLSGAS